MEHDRRAFPRVRVVIELYGRTVPLGIPIALLDISLSGMAIRTELPLQLDAHHCFELTLADGSTVLLDGEIARRQASPATPSGSACASASRSASQLCFSASSQK